jgi:hypothetical protein
MCQSTCPCLGVCPFDRNEAGIFFGCEEQIDQMLEKLMHSYFLAVVGAYGCGKSSLVRARMIPALEMGYMSDSGSSWRAVTMRPGDEPLYNLAYALVSSFVLCRA